MNINNNIKKTLITKEMLDERIAEIAKQISIEYVDKNPVMICLLKGSVSYFAHLCENIHIPLEYEFLRASSYHGATTTGEVKLLHVPTIPLKNRHVIIVEDIIDSGNTLHYLVEILYKRRPNSIKICTLLDKPERRTADVKVDYSGFNIPDEFVVGYGLDYAQKYRNLPFIGVVEFTE